jgi:hypothetical protein
MPAVPEELPEALAAIPWPWGHLAILAVLVLGLLTYLQRRHKLLSDARLGLVFLSVLIQLFTGKPKTFVNCFNVRHICVCVGILCWDARDKSYQSMCAWVWDAIITETGRLARERWNI